MSKSIPSYEIPTEMRDFAEKSVDQARKAFDGFLGAAHKAVSAADSQTVNAPSQFARSRGKGDWLCREKHRCGI